MQSYIRKRWPVSIVITFIIMAAILYPRERYLLNIANKFEGFPNWDVNCGYDWLTSNEVMICRGSEKTGMKLFIRDLADKHEIELKDLNRHFTNSFVRHGDVQISPDRHWILWTDEVDGFCTARLDGSGYHKWDGSWLTEDCFWAADSRYWFSLGGGVYPKERYQQAVIHAIDASMKDRSVPIRPDNQPALSLAATGNPTSCIITSWHQNSSRILKLQITEICLLSNMARLRKLIVSPPKNIKEAGYVAVSPAGDRIAWLVETEANMSFPQWLRRLLPTLHVGPQRAIGLWVSHLDGSNMTEIGHIKLPSDDSNGDMIAYDLRWLPDCKHVSFVYNGALWIVVGRVD